MVNQELGFHPYGAVAYHFNPPPIVVISHVGAGSNPGCSASGPVPC